MEADAGDATPTHSEFGDTDDEKEQPEEDASDDDAMEEEDGADAKLQKLLDTPLIDPTQDNADDPEFLRRFKQLVNDFFIKAI